MVTSVVRAGVAMTPNTFVPTDLLTVAELAKSLRVSTMTVYRLVHSGTIESVRFGRSYRIPRAAVQQYLITTDILH